RNSGYFDGNRDSTRVAVVQRRELLDPSPTHGGDDAFADAPVQVADELRVGLGQLPEGAVQERDVGATPGKALALRIEPEAVHLAEQRLDARLGVGPAARLGAPQASGGGRV